MGALYSQDIGDCLTLFIFNEKADESSRYGEGLAIKPMDG